MPGTFGVDAGTAVEVEEFSFTMRRVRVLSGVHRGGEGWVRMEFVHQE